MAVVELLYQLVANLIDYRGELASLGTIGWPLRRYPLALPAPTPQ